MDLKQEIEQKAHELHRLLDKEAELEMALKSVGENISMLQVDFTKIMKDGGIIKAQVEGVGEIKLTSSIYASILETDRPEVFAKLREMGEGGLIKTVESVHASTLKSWVKGLIDEGKTIPDKIKYGFREEVKIK